MSSNVLYYVDVLLPLSILFCYFLFSCLSVASFPFTFSHLLLWIYIHIHSLHSIRISYGMEKREAERSAFLVSFVPLPISTQKTLVSEKFRQQISLWKKRLASHPEQSFFSCQDGKCIFWGSEWSLSATTQHWRKCDPSPPLKSSSKIMKVFAIFLIPFSLTLWFSSLHTWLFSWPLLLSFDHYP